MKTDKFIPDTASRTARMVLIFFSLASVFAADDPVRIHPDEIIGAALEHSFSLQTADQEIRAAEARQQQASAQAWPSLDLKSQAFHYEGLKDMVLEPGYTIPNVDTRYNAAITLTQPLFTGHRITRRKDSAAFQQQAARQDRQATEANVVWDTLYAYWNWSKAFYSVDTLEAAVARMRAHAADMHALHESGLATENDRLATDVLLDQTCLRREETLRHLNVARARIAYLTGRELPAAAAPDRALTVTPGAIPTESEALETARTRRPELAARQQEVKASEAAVKVNRADYYPQLYLAAAYEQGRPNLLDFPPTDEWNDDAYVGALLTWNLLDWGLTRGKVAEALARSTQTKIRRSQVEEQIILEVREARVNLQNAVARAELAERTELSAKRNLEAATDLWQNGLSRHSDVLDAHTQLTQAQHEKEVARADVILARAALDHATGQLRPAGPALAGPPVQAQP